MNTRLESASNSNSRPTHLPVTCEKSQWKVQSNGMPNNSTSLFSSLKTFLWFTCYLQILRKVIIWNSYMHNGKVWIRDRPYILKTSLFLQSKYVVFSSETDNIALSHYLVFFCLLLYVKLSFSKVNMQFFYLRPTTQLWALFRIFCLSQFFWKKRLWHKNMKALHYEKYHDR